MEKNQTMTDEQLARELQNGKRGGGRGKGADSEHGRGRGEAGAP